MKAKEMSNDRKLTAQIAAAYFDAKVYIHDDRLHPSNKIQSIIGVTKTKIVYSESSSSFFDGWFHISACQLILKKLEDISDEDCLEVAKILLPVPFERRTKGWVVSRDFTITGYPYIKIHHPMIVYSVQIDAKLVNFDIDNTEDRETGAHDMKPTAIIDYLRSKSYDCGYGAIPNLIDAGIAIVDTKTDEK